MISIIKNSYSGLVKKGNSNIYMCIPSSINRRVFFNEFAVEIYEKCDGSSISNLIIHYLKIFENVNYEVLKRDIENIVWFFYNLQMLDIMGDEIMVKQDKKEIISMLGEKDFSAVSKFIISKYNDSSFLVYYTPRYGIKKVEDVENKFNLPILRLSQVNGENFYFKYSKEDSEEIDGVLGFRFIENYITVYISILVISARELENALRPIVKKFKEEEYEYIKIEVLASDSFVIRELERLGFIKEALLIKEAPFGEDIVLYRLNL